MRPIWTGGVTFGLVYIPVRLYSATNAIQLDLDLLSKKDKAPIRYARINAKTGEEIAWKDVVKGYEHKKGSYVVLEPDDFEKVDMEKSQNLEITSFVDEVDVDPIYFDTPYYLEPDPKAKKLYALLNKALKKSGKVGVAEFVMRNRERLCLIAPKGNMLILNQMRYEEEVRSAKDLELPGNVDVNDKELDMALELIKKMTDEFDISEYKDDYIAKLKKLIEAKAKHKTVHVSKPAEHHKIDADDLTKLLQESLTKFKTESHAS